MGRVPLKLHFADRAFLGMYIPAGEHDIELSFQPHAVINGAIVSIAAAVMLTIAILWTRRSRRADVSRLTER